MSGRPHGHAGSVTESLVVEIAGKAYQGVDNMDGTAKLPGEKIAGLPVGTDHLRLPRGIRLDSSCADSTTNALTVAKHRVCAAQTTSPPLLSHSNDSAKKTPDRTGWRTTLLVPLPAELTWQDMAFLAAIPATTFINHGAPSLVALDAAGTLAPEIQDYLRRYRPDEVFLLGNAADDLVIAGRTCGLLKAGSADEAACALSARFWRTSATAVICPAGDYEAGLVAAPLAARLRAPLLFTAGQGLARLAMEELRRLKTRELIVVGKPAGGLQSLKQVTDQLTELATARDVLIWARNRRPAVAYLAALNPLDRNKTVIKKLSLAGALLAAGRDGLVVPLPYEVTWKLPFNGVEVRGELPAGLPPSEARPKAGRISFGKREYAFILTGKSDDRDLKDLHRSGW